ncbi:diguanylate cyclase domain-containing protein [Ferrovum myxofaciens]|uniref:diguanylate cyclase domain-containing protein n=1 Tax=Ferrovum myxofaciens TaxID=416213 RepID=UPI003EBEE354
MTVKNIQRILVIGAGRGGLAMLDLFREDPLINIVGIIDTDPQAPALAIARKHGILDFTNLTDAIKVSRPCLAFNLTGDDSITAYVESQLGSGNIIGGFQARFIWTLLTRLKQTNEQITALAHHDSLTGLPNRILFYDRLNQAITRALRDKESIAVLYLDLDGFKHINDTLGHDAGDALLRETAKRIMACVRESDTVARIGGDEFTMILSNARTTNSKDRVAKKIVDAIAHPFMINGKNCTVSASIGISLYPDHGETAEQLVKIADAAMYLAKHSGKNCYCYTKPPSGCTSIF